MKERIRLIKSLKAMKPAYALQEMRRLFYDKYVQAGDPSLHIRNTGTWFSIRSRNSKRRGARFDSVERFVAYVDELSLRHARMEALKDKNEGDAVQLMTIHRAKGLEFPYVYLIGASEGILPHSTALKDKPPEELKAVRPEAAEEQIYEAALEEERRLAYVAVTRAKERLYISSPAYYHAQQTCRSVAVFAGGLRHQTRQGIQIRFDPPCRGFQAAYPAITVGNARCRWRGNDQKSGG
ncbi:3'-5' exonuclease [Paenibacillus sp. JTLBN-2024]